MIGTRPSASRFALVAGFLLAGVVLFLAGFWLGPAGGGKARDDGAASRTMPDWFLPIWDAYGRNPTIAPDFDFASLYSPGSARSYNGAH